MVKLFTRDTPSAPDRAGLLSLRTAALLLTTLLLVSCAPPPLTSQGTLPPHDDSAQLAEQMLSAGNYTGAANEYLRLSELNEAPKKHYFRLRAAEILKTDQQAEQAKDILLDPNSVTTHPLLDTKRKILLADIHLSESQPELGLKALSNLPPAELPVSLQQELHTIKAKAHEAQAQSLEAARERIVLDSLLTAPEQLAANRQALWNDINALPVETLQGMVPTAEEHLRGWIELAVIARTDLHDGSRFNSQLSNWRLSHPSHPAEQEIIPGLTVISDELNQPPRQIALLLPLDGKFAPAAAAIRDGFISAWYDDAQNPARPLVKVYNGTPGNILSVYQQAIDEGAALVVGPLEKDAVEQLTRDGPVLRRTLALNQISADELDQDASSYDPKFYQFGLLPEEEAKQAAERAWFDGHVQALVLTPESDWGERVFGAFKEHWENLGGIVLEHQTFSPRHEDFASSVRRLLDHDDSKQRAEDIGALLEENVGYAAPGRGDADFIFMAAFPIEARQLAPQLRFHGARLPIYATSHVYSFTDRLSPDRDLDGVLFGDMPRVLQSTKLSPEIRESIERDWPSQPTAYLRLYTFGRDAYKIIPHLGQLRAQPFSRFPGETGTLSMDEFGRVVRQLTWARFVDGLPHLIDSAE